MTWIKLEEKAPRHPKIFGLSHLAFRVWVTSLCYASEFLTDGILPPVYLITVKAHIREELTTAGLWDVDGEQTRIHDYLGHQSSRQDVDHKKERNQAKSKAWRDRQNQNVTGNGETTVTGNGVTSVTSESPIQIQIQRTDTENREQRQRKAAAAPLIMSPALYEERRKFCAFVGSKIEVPNGLHAELRKGHGGPNPEQELQSWYLDVNEQAETDEWRIPQGKDFYPWFKALYGQKFPAPVVIPKRDNTALMARLQAIERGEIKR